MRRARSLTEQDRATWASYAQLVKPRAGVLLPPMPALPVPVVAVAPDVRPPPVRAVGARPAVPVVVNDTPGGVDRGTWARFRGGKLAATRTLDLHGRTAQRAHADLERFLYAAAAEGVRCVEVITGRGSGETGGVIRREFPMWLNQVHLRPLILGAAHPHALNPGSVRLLLRRRRT